MGARWRSVTAGVSARLRCVGPVVEPNPWNSFLKAANVSFDYIILFGPLIALGNYESLQSLYGISRGDYLQMARIEKQR